MRRSSTKASFGLLRSRRRIGATSDWQPTSFIGWFLVPGPGAARWAHLDSNQGPTDYESAGYGPDHDFVTDVHRGHEGDRTTHGRTLRELIEECRAVMSPRSTNGLHHLDVGLGYVQLVDLTPKLIVSYLTMRRDRASGPTANRARSLLAHLLRIAVINGYIPA